MIPQNANPRVERLAGVLQHLDRSVRRAGMSLDAGIVSKASGTSINVNCSGLRVGEICRIFPENNSTFFEAEVVSVAQTTATLFPLVHPERLSAGSRVEATGRSFLVPVGPYLLGSVIDGFGVPIGSRLPDSYETRGLKGSPISPLDRPLIEKPMSTGVKAIDLFSTLGFGQRICLMGAAGTGKSTLMAAIARHCQADVVVIGLIGERGREVKEFIDRHLPHEHRNRIVVVAATSDRTATERFYAAHTASTVAEYFRDQGKSVLIILDSLTRVARALREIGLSLGEPPTRRGYPASVYPQLPKLIERSGRAPRGDITAIYTVLMEGEQEDDPVAEEVKSLTDGHIALSRDLAQRGQYPAIDPLKSLSRVMTDIMDEEHCAPARRARQLLAKYKEIEILVQVGEYKSGSDPIADEAMKKVTKIEEALKQDVREGVDLPTAFANLAEALA
ncbi:MAG: FliI/YscN family ATPase [Albidovulum sp.]|uniref:FliI/YscN family ATPase n=1 Tax=Albidovulum sp. TaxID=1872424 RepID=UPI003CA00B65